MGMQGAHRLLVPTRHIWRQPGGTVKSHSLGMLAGATALLRLLLVASSLHPACFREHTRLGFSLIAGLPGTSFSSFLLSCIFKMSLITC